MLLDLNKDIDRSKFKDRSIKLLEKRVIIDLTEKTNRTLKQNNYMHLICAYFGSELGYTTEESKSLFKTLNRDIFEYEKNNVKFIKSSADVTKDELTKAIGKFRMWSNDNAGLYLPEANEKEFLTQVQVQTSQNNYL